VIDKDLAAQLLARRLDVATLVLATDVEHVMAGYGTPGERPLGRTTVAELRALAAAGHFAGGSMGPKVEAALRFVTAGPRIGTRRRAAITSLDRITDAAQGKAGTIIEE
jgi:carbamate kinase